MSLHELKSRIDQLESWYARCAAACGIEHVPDTGPTWPGPIEEVERAIKEGARALGDLAELRAALTSAVPVEEPDIPIALAEAIRMTVPAVTPASGWPNALLALRSVAERAQQWLRMAHQRELADTLAFALWGPDEQATKTRGPGPMIRIVKDDPETDVRIVGLPAEDFDLLLATVRALLSNEQEARSMTMAVQTGRVPVDDERVQRIGRGTMECFDRLRSIAAGYPGPAPKPELRLVGDPRPELVVTGAPNATVSNAEPQYHDHLLRRRNAPFSSDAGEGHSFHAITAADGSWIKVGWAPEGATSLVALEMTIDKAELARAALGAAINEAKRRRG